MYVERKAKPGECVRHKVSGDIITAEIIREDGAVLHSNVMSEYGDYVMDRYYWRLDEYFVIEREPEPDLDDLHEQYCEEWKKKYGFSS
ncbi:hypothetical protein CN378_12655 [Bacillus sp. AFS015802]|uniref:hypothetical protein n=1 Tax=Bacillus sp. AFS015802 TaxID=2033486 RepID=UPI000BF4A65B|nr:hypothetical protein [Bacillus sp. AFS015802]PFA66859.1 hypothetical protein CN378_12655 [Bacillus sp. AFS015802]